MSIRRFTALAVFLLPAALVHADDFPFAGTWKIAGAAHAPWEDPAHPMITDDEQKYDNKLVTISKDAIRGPDLLGCGKTEITVETLPFAGLFEGGLAQDPKNSGGGGDDYDEEKAKKLALQLGFTSEPVPTLYQGCSEISLHLRDASTLLFGLNNHIFTMKKVITN